MDVETNNTATEMDATSAPSSPQTPSDRDKATLEDGSAIKSQVNPMAEGSTTQVLEMPVVSCAATNIISTGTQSIVLKGNGKQARSAV